MNNDMNNDLISREALKNLLLDSHPDDLQQSDINFDTGDIKISLSFVMKIIDNAPTALFPLTVQIIDKVTDEDIETLKELMKDYKPQILNLKTERPQGKFVEMLKDRIEESVCKYCQMNKHCELCEISRVFSIIDLTNEEMKDGAE